jgi:hypothetical protein
MNIAYFAHELEDPAVLKRVEMLTAGGAHVELLGFERGRHASTPDGQKPHVLGRTEGGRLVSRIASVLLAAPRAWRLQALWARADAVLARNLEMLAIVVALGGLMRERPRVVYECLDIHQLMLSDKAPGKVLRAIERACLKRTALVVTSSPAFETRYFRARQGWSGAALLLENKVLALDEPAPKAAPRQARPKGPPWRIAWCGVLRCRKSLHLLRALTDELQGRVEVELWGAPSLKQVPDFHEVVAGARHLTFKGAYTRADLPKIYAGAHFVWAIDYYEAGGNSDWLLPNRLYEGLRFGAVPIAVGGVETARWLENRGVGLVLDEPLAASARTFFTSCTDEQVAALADAAAALAPGATTVAVEDCRALAAALAGRETVLASRAAALAEA